ncbi:MAG: hypothetical protein ABIT04_00350 [Novosphingobium sp.]
MAGSKTNLDALGCGSGERFLDHNSVREQTLAGWDPSLIAFTFLVGTPCRYISASVVPSAGLSAREVTDDDGCPGLSRRRAMGHAETLRAAGTRRAGP